MTASEPKLLVGPFVETPLLHLSVVHMCIICPGEPVSAAKRQGEPQIPDAVRPPGPRTHDEAQLIHVSNRSLFY